MQIGNFATPREGFDNPQEGRIYARGGQSPTMRTNGVYWIFDNELTQDNMAKRYRIRKLTPKECFRLMGVSDEDIEKIQNYPLVPGKDGKFVPPEGMTEAETKKLKISESQQYRMAGNSIVVQVMEGIFSQLFRKDGDCLF